ncbi:uncharacterized protein LOC120271948 isoform X2 [Dioscorea cayenensis subsp. rotundata]|uniref:Uncharacterized protein LOC120271948 isoform X2 n=1 Tax=Dioscorea cayennensis subsp. rotundata TaxID=55577 RepID=A0AB40C461_DIOCR|nr:uncharacterized protein LOC120271948 isoform X2 [Dioscorea cayenensis subsp. rotundata]
MQCLGPPDLGTEKTLTLAHSNSPPPILHTSLQIPPPYPPQSKRSFHLHVIDQVSAMLHMEDMDEDSNGDSSDDADDEDEDMSEDGEPDDDMTLVQYQEEVKHEAIIRKSAHSSCSSPKKRLL